MTTVELKWIAVKDRLPDFNEVVVCTDGKRRWIDARMKGYGETLELYNRPATHWFPIPSIIDMP